MFSRQSNVSLVFGSRHTNNHKERVGKQSTFNSRTMQAITFSAMRAYKGSARCNLKTSSATLRQRKQRVQRKQEAVGRKPNKIVKIEH